MAGDSVATEVTTTGESLVSAGESVMVASVGTAIPISKGGCVAGRIVESVVAASMISPVSLGSLVVEDCPSGIGEPVLSPEGASVVGASVETTGPSDSILGVDPVD